MFNFSDRVCFLGRSLENVSPTTQNPAFSGSSEMPSKQFVGSPWTDPILSVAGSMSHDVLLKARLTVTVGSELQGAVN
jgi:hypothetical protein